MSELVYMNARRIEHDKIQDNEGKSKLYPVIYQQGYIYEVGDATAKAWCKVHVSIPIINNTVTLRDGKTRKLTPAKLKELTREPDRPNHPVKRTSRPSLDDDTVADVVPINRKRKRKTKASAGKKKSTRKASKKAKKRGKKKT